MEVENRVRISPSVQILTVRIDLYITDYIKCKRVYIYIYFQNIQYIMILSNLPYDYTLYAYNKNTKTHIQHEASVLGYSILLSFIVGGYVMLIASTPLTNDKYEENGAPKVNQLGYIALLITGDVALFVFSMLLVLQHFILCNDLWKKGLNLRIASIGIACATGLIITSFLLLYVLITVLGIDMFYFYEIPALLVILFALVFTISIMKYIASYIKQVASSLDGSVKSEGNTNKPKPIRKGMFN